VQPENRLTCAPPGKCNNNQPNLKNILVASPPRAGTHLLIDLLLNNFKQYCRIPLYVNGDALTENLATFEDLLNCKGYIIKIHYPANPACQRSPWRDDLFRILREECLVLSTNRRSRDQIASMAKMWPKMEVRDFASMLEDFNSFWADSVLAISYESLIDSEQVNFVLDKLESIIPAVISNDRRLPQPKSSECSILISKLLTRLIGCKAPLINTGIKLG